MELAVYDGRQQATVVMEVPEVVAVFSAVRVLSMLYPVTGQEMQIVEDVKVPEAARKQFGPRPVKLLRRKSEVSQSALLGQHLRQEDLAQTSILDSPEGLALSVVRRLLWLADSRRRRVCQLHLAGSASLLPPSRAAQSQPVTSSSPTRPA